MLNSRKFLWGRKKYQARGTKELDGAERALVTLDQTRPMHLVDANVGQNKICSNVVVYRSLEGTIAKRIVHAIQPKVNITRDYNRAQNFLQNLKGIFFYSTPRSTAYQFGERSTGLASLVDFEELQAQTQRLNDRYPLLIKEKRIFNHAKESGTRAIKGRKIGGGPYAEGGAEEKHEDVVKLSNADHFPVCNGGSKEPVDFLTSKTLREGIPNDFPANGGSDLSYKLLSKDLKSVRILGKGYSGIVYETLWNGGRYARKDFLRVLSDIFEREAKVLVHLPEHPNVVQAIGWTVDNKSCSLVQEILDGNVWNLAQRRKKLELKRQGSSNREPSPKERVTPLQKLTGDELKVSRGSSTCTSQTIYPFPVLEAIDIISEIAKGLKFLHDRKVAHGDLKPRNILVKLKTRGPSTSPDQELAIGAVKLADYGLIGSKSKVRCMTSASPEAEMLNSIRWKAPELVDGSSGSSLRHGFEDLAKGDVYSFGVTCFEFLTGSDTFSDYTVNPAFDRKELVNDIVTRQRRSLPPSFPQRLSELINQCWALDKTKRPTFDHIVEELENIKLELILGRLLLVILWYTGELIPKGVKGSSVSLQAIQYKVFFLYLEWIHSSTTLLHLRSTKKLENRLKRF